MSFKLTLILLSSLLLGCGVKSPPRYKSGRVLPSAEYQYVIPKVETGNSDTLDENDSDDQSSIKKED
ncbi:hypothetical protein HBN50_16870 [Halobacteriovorax sp. GB3]|uniref:hypothetical protein n=1 Tax=Halobacteriovorax sp. GB3 TaxID=2719615 RepID=UPI002361BFAD|nr:hypothetical protein [Halobacteriovorax sp. GB3]MDD0854784.1 hypothetical protein [Halobacteriovorax sp. GB3]